MIKKYNECVGKQLNKIKEIGLKYKEVLYVNQFVWLTSKTFLPYVIYDWSTLDPSIRSPNSHRSQQIRSFLKKTLMENFIFSAVSYDIFRNALLKFIRPVERNLFDINDPFAIKMLARLRIGF